MVAAVTRLKDAASTVHYFEADGYYARNDPEHRKASGWHGEAAAALGLRGPVKAKRFEALLAGYVPGTGRRLGRLRDGEHQHRPGVDVTFSASKSVSLEALVYASRRTRARIVRAHDEAVRATLDFIEKELLQTRGYDPATGEAAAHQGPWHGGGNFPAHREPQPRPAPPYPRNSRQHDAEPDGRLAERRVHIGRALEAAHRSVLPQRASDAAREHRLRHGSDARGPDARVRDCGLHAADTRCVLDPSPGPT